MLWLITYAQVFKFAKKHDFGVPIIHDNSCGGSPEGLSEFINACG